MRNALTLIVAAFLCPLGKLYAQSSSNLPLDNVISIPSKYLSKIENKFSKVNQDVTKQTEKYIQRFAKQEEKLNRKLSKYESTAGSHLNDGQKFYVDLLSKINGKININKTVAAGTYLPYVDSVQTSLSFLEKNNQLLSSTKDIQGKVQSSLTQVKETQPRLQVAEKIKQLIQQRQAQLKQQLSQYTNLSEEVNKLYAGYSHNLYYYSAQLKEYKDIINDPDKLTKKTLSLLNQSSTFQAFAKKYSQLAGLFGLPINYGTTESLAGLQTRNQVQSLIQTQINAANAGGGNGVQALQQSLQAAQGQLNNLKDKLSKYGNNGANMEMPDFKPNDQKTKPFRQRLEYGFNLQTAKTNFFPTTTDIGLSIGYKLNNTSTIGIGASYKIGWGKDIKHISLTEQGVGLRSYLDIKLKGSFYATGGFEYNYQPIAPEVINSVNSLRKFNDPSAWSRSGLLGISKIVSIKSKFFKKTKAQLLWDFLSYQQVPQTQPIKFRVGYNF